MYSYNYNMSRSAAGALAGIGTGTIVVSLALAIFSIVCMWKVFEKAGEPGWKCLIPIYNFIVFYRIAWEVKYFVLTLLGILLSALLMGIGFGRNSGAMTGIGSFLIVILYVAIFVLQIIAMVKLARRFGKSGAFAVGLILLNTIFIAILAFDDSDYDRRRTDPQSAGSTYTGSNPYADDRASQPEDKYPE